jgi:RNA polymerase sigma-70 factor (ECF subfamily)
MRKTPHKSFILIYRKLALPLTKFIVKRMGGDQEAAEEVFSRTITAAFEGYHTFKNKSSFFTWMCRIALNKIADYYREEVNKNSKIVAPFFEELASYDSREMTPEEWYVLNELCNSVKDCIKLLPPEKQQLLFLRFWKQMTIKQIAKTLGISERSVEGKIYRSKILLAKIFSEKHPEFITASEKVTK